MICLCVNMAGSGMLKPSSPLLPRLQELLRGKWLAMAGGSIARSLFAALLRLAEDAAPPSRHVDAPLRCSHCSSCSFTIGALKCSALWVARGCYRWYLSFYWRRSYSPH